jgi:hypothetical protein
MSSKEIKKDLALLKKIQVTSNVVLPNMHRGKWVVDDFTAITWFFIS